mmetsp:Transcript_11513/g.29966  ORF Transcript_11513/g.29966 Transcript_11513/m.29966 type:complete len:140 (-) Transcript_11513:195-614(-)
MATKPLLQLRQALGDNLTGVNESKQIIVDGCFCCNSALYLEQPGCLGVSAKGELCCLEGECCIKPKAPPISKLYCIDLRVTNFQLRLKKQVQYCCCVANFALPPDNEIPITFAKFGLQIYPKIGCCQTQGVMTGTMGRL